MLVPKLSVLTTSSGAFQGTLHKSKTSVSIEQNKPVSLACSLKAGGRICCCNLCPHNSVCLSHTEPSSSAGICSGLWGTVPACSGMCQQGHGSIQPSVASAWTCHGWGPWLVVTEEAASGRTWGGKDAQFGHCLLSCGWSAGQSPWMHCIMSILLLPSKTDTSSLNITNYTITGKESGLICTNQQCWSCTSTHSAGVS